MNKGTENAIIAVIIMVLLSICSYLYQIRDKIIGGDSIQKKKSELVILAPPAISNIISEFAKIYTEERNADVTVRFLPIEDLIKSITLKKKISNPDISTLVIIPHLDNVMRISNIESNGIKYAEERTIHHLWNDNIVVIAKDNSFCYTKKCEKFDNIASLLTLIHVWDRSSDKLSILDHDDIVRHGIVTLYETFITRMCNIFGNTVMPNNNYTKKDILVKRNENDINSFYTDDDISIIIENKELLFSKNIISYLAALQNNSETKVNIVTDIQYDVLDITNMLINKCITDAKQYYNQHIYDMIWNMKNLDRNIVYQNWDILFGLKSNLRNIGVPIVDDTTSILKIWGICRNNKQIQSCISATDFFLTNDRIKQMMIEQELTIAETN